MRAGTKFLYYCSASVRVNSGMPVMIFLNAGGVGKQLLYVYMFIAFTRE